MPSIDMYNFDHEIVGSLELNDAVFAAKVNPHLHYEVVKWQLAKRRSGNACTKDRSLIAGSTHKLYRQKGTGNARRGSIKSPLLKGGGTVFGPKPRDFSYSLPKKVRKAAVRSILSSRLQENGIVVVDSMTLDAISTKKVLEKFSKFGKGKTLVVDGDNERLYKSVRNISNMKFLPMRGINVYDIINHDMVILSKDAVNYIEGVYGHDKRSV